MLPHITTAMKKKFSPSDLAEIIARQTGTENAVAEAFVRKFFEVIEDGLLSDKFVKIKGFGTFKLVSVGERESVNINTGERFQISGHTKVSFTPDTSLKELVNRPFAHFETVDLSDDTDMTEFDEIDKRVAEECQELLDDTDDDDNAADDTNPESNETNVTESSDRMVDSTANHEESSTIQSAKTKMQAPPPCYQNLEPAANHQLQKTTKIPPLFPSLQVHPTPLRMKTMQQPKKWTLKQ